VPNSADDSFGGPVGRPYLPRRCAANYTRFIEGTIRCSEQVERTRVVEIKIGGIRVARISGEVGCRRNRQSLRNRSRSKRALGLAFVV